MYFRPILAAMAALTASGCVSSDNGYAYCYDPWRGPVGYYTGPFEAKPACARQPDQAGVFVARQGDGYRGAYVSGPHPSPVTEVGVDAATREAAR